jgi:hypothetical protein
MLSRRGAGTESLDQVRPTPPWLLRKNVNLKELYVEIVQECDSKGVTDKGGQIEGFAWFRNGKDPEAGALYTRQYSKLVNGCQMKVVGVALVGSRGLVSIPPPLPQQSGDRGQNERANGEVREVRAGACRG